MEKFGTELIGNSSLASLIMFNDMGGGEQSSFGNKDKKILNLSSFGSGFILNSFGNF